MRKKWLVFLLLFLFFVQVAFAISKGKGNFMYDTRNPPHVWFFPDDKAKWNGLEITVKDWKGFEPEQKRRFIEEYIDMAHDTLLDDYIIMEDANAEYHIIAIEIFVRTETDDTVDMQTLILSSLIASGDVEKREE
jgi:hypothetical protein